MKKIIIVILFLSFSQFVQSQQVAAQGINVRGLIKTFLAYNQSYAPVQSAVVALYHYDNNKHQWIIAAKTLTNQYGYYYFYRLKPGQYYIQVNGKNNYRINVTKVNINAYQFQDVPVIYN